MVMTYEQARQYEKELREVFGESALQAEVTGGLPEHPAEFDLEQAKQEFQDRLEEGEDREYTGPDPYGDPWLRVEPESLHGVIEHLKTSSDYDFQSLHCLGGDHLAERGEMVVVYHLYSHSSNRWIVLKTFVPEDEPIVPSVTDLYRAADWHERETYDMLGIRFEGHPDLRRILCPEDWDGFPLRKDYEFPQFYRGLPVDWDEARGQRMSRDDYYSEIQELDEMTDFDEELHFPPGDGR